MRFLIPLALATASLGVSSAVFAIVCRQTGVNGFDNSRIEMVKSWIGETQDPNSLRLYISRGEITDPETGDSTRVLYVHSNLYSKDLGDSGYADNATKLVEREGNLKSLESTVMNTVFYNSKISPPEGWPSDYEALTREYAKNAEIIIDDSILEADGRPPFDVSAAKQIMLATDRGIIETGKIETIRIKSPPPVLIESIAGCCFKGRPAGRGSSIRRSLESLSFNPKDIGLLSMVRDSATSKAISDSPTLRAAAARGGDEGLSWGARLAAALEANRGHSLVVLGHVSKGMVVVESPSGKAEFTKPLDEVHAMAKDAGVNLVFLGCETAKNSDATVGIAEKFNTRFAAGQLDSAMRESQTAFEFLQNLSTEGLTVVAQEGAWSAKGIGATYYQRSSARSRLLRVFRLWFFGE